jgi:GNAT superfamily N-acetyltransferase
MPFSVRRATHEDIDALVNLAEIMAATTEFRHLTFDREKLTNSAHQWVDNLGYLVLGAYDGDEPIGMFVGFLSDYFFAREMLAKDLCLFVLPGRRGGKAALRLVQAFHAWAKQSGVRDVVIGVSSGGEQAQRAGKFLEHLGLENIGGLYRRQVNV